MNTIILLLRRWNEGLAVAAGALLLLTVLVTLFDIATRPFGLSIGGTDEISGYAMAISTSWGVSYALTNMAHVRIDLLRAQSNPRGRALFDLFAIVSLAGVALTIGYRVWPVLAQSIRNNALANTTLETPLWIPQSLWLAGWLWFAVSAVVIASATLTFTLTGRYKAVEDVAGLRGEI